MIRPLLGGHTTLAFSSSEVIYMDAAGPYAPAPRSSLSLFSQIHYR